MTPSLNLLVLRCRDLPACRAFYEWVGLTFERHVHGNGPEHFAHEADGGRFVFELYPAADGEAVDQTGVGFAVDELEAVHAPLAAAGASPGAIKEQPWGVTFVVRDPDGRRVEVKRA